MKKLVAIPFLFLYLLSLSGMAVCTKYCCGKIACVKIYFGGDKCAGHKKDNKNCCSDIAHFFKVHDAQQSGASDITFPALLLQLHAVLPIINTWTCLYAPEQSHNTFLFHSPPLQAAVPLFIRHEIFLI